MNLLLPLLHKFIPPGQLTHLCMTALGLLMAVYGIDAWVHDLKDTPEIETGWIAAGHYLAIGGFIGLVGGSALRDAIDRMKKKLGPTP